MLDHPQPHRRHLEHLPAGHPHHRGVSQPYPTPSTHPRTMLHHLIGSSTCDNAAPGEPGLPGMRPGEPRNDRGGGLAKPSKAGGLDELPEFSPNRRSKSASRACNTPICPC